MGSIICRTYLADSLEIDNIVLTERPNNIRAPQVLYIAPILPMPADAQSSK